MINKKRLIKLAQDLIRIDSQNPPGNEFNIGRFVKQYFENLGLQVKTYEFKKNRTNVIAVLGGKQKRRTLLVTPHLDTVPAGKNWTIDPLKAIIRKNIIYGLGATDCKGNLAVGMEAIRSLVEEKTALSYDIIFAATADEESGSILGLEQLLDRGILRPDAALVLDTDDFNIVMAQKGLMHIKIKIEGKKAHGAHPWMGVNAIDQAIAVIKKIKAYRFSVSKNKYLHGPTINIGTVRGGDKVNVVADWCEFELDLRFLPGESSKRLLAGIKKIARDNTNKFQIEVEGIQEPFVIDEHHPLVSCLTKSMRALKIKPILAGSEGATVISFFQDKKIPSLATGFGAAGCEHMVDEYAEIDNLYKGALVLEEFLKRYSGGKSNGRN